MSPAASYQSDLEAPEHLQLQNESPDVGGKRHYFFARDRKADVTSQPQASSVGSNGLAQQSRSSVLSGEDSRKSTSMDRSAARQSGEALAAGATSDSERESRKEKNPVRWIKGKLQDFADKFDHPERTRDEQRRMVSPTRGQQQPAMAMGTTTLKPGGASPRRQQQPSEPRSSMQLRPSAESRQSDIGGGGRGKSFDVPRATPAQAPSLMRQSQDLSARSLSPPVTSAEPGAAPTIVPPQAVQGGKQ
jgi:hypothetical protein